MNSYLKVEVSAGMFSCERVVAFEDLNVGRRTLMLDESNLVGDKLPVNIISRGRGRVLVRLSCCENLGSLLAEVHPRIVCDFMVN